MCRHTVIVDCEFSQGLRPVIRTCDYTEISIVVYERTLPFGDPPNRRTALSANERLDFTFLVPCQPAKSQKSHASGDCVLVSLSNGRREEGKPKQDLNVTGGIVHAHTRDP